MKSYGLPGLRIGWLATRAATCSTARRRKHYTSICNATTSEALATIALRRGEAIQARNRGIVAADLPGFEALFAEHPGRLEWEAPRAGCVSFPRYLGADAVEASAALVERAGVVLLPASIFASALGRPGRRFAWVGRRDPEPGLKALDAFLRAGRGPRRRIPGAAAGTARAASAGAAAGARSHRPRAGRCSTAARRIRRRRGGR